MPSCGGGAMLAHTSVDRRQPACGEVWNPYVGYGRSPQFLIHQQLSRKCEDLTTMRVGRIRTSLLGYRITRRFVKTYFGRVFNQPPHIIFTEEMLRPRKTKASKL